MAIIFLLYWTMGCNGPPQARPHFNKLGRLSKYGDSHDTHMAMMISLQRLIYAHTTLENASLLYKIWYCFTHLYDIDYQNYTADYCVMKNHHCLCELLKDVLKSLSSWILVENMKGITRLT